MHPVCMDGQFQDFCVRIYLKLKTVRQKSRTKALDVMWFESRNMLLHMLSRNTLNCMIYR